MISLCAGGRHSLVLALPDSSAIDRSDAGGQLSDILQPLEISSPTAGGAAHGQGGQLPNGLTPRSAGAAGTPDVERLIMFKRLCGIQHLTAGLLMLWRTKDRRFLL